MTHKQREAAWLAWSVILSVGAVFAFHLRFKPLHVALLLASWLLSLVVLWVAPPRGRPTRPTREEEKLSPVGGLMGMTLVSAVFWILPGTNVNVSKGLFFTAAFVGSYLLALLTDPSRT